MQFIVPEYNNLISAPEYDISPSVCNKCYKRSILYNITFSPAYYTWEDGLFNYEVLQYTKSIVCIPDILYFVSNGGYVGRYHLSQTYFDNMIKNWISYYEDCRSTYEDRYDFTSLYVRNAFWCVTYELIKRAFKNKDKNSIYLILKNATVKQWIFDNLGKIGFERKIIDTILMEDFKIFNYLKIQYIKESILGNRIILLYKRIIKNIFSQEQK